MVRWPDSFKLPQKSHDMGNCYSSASKELLPTSNRAAYTPIVWYPPAMTQIHAEPPKAPVEASQFRTSNGWNDPPAFLFDKKH